jgi:hypothetical protein
MAIPFFDRSAADASRPRRLSVDVRAGDHIRLAQHG